MLLFWFCLAFWRVTTNDILETKSSEGDLEHMEYRQKAEWKITETWAYSSFEWSQPGAQDGVHRKWRGDGHREKLSRTRSFLVLGCCDHIRKAVRGEVGMRKRPALPFFLMEGYHLYLKLLFFWFSFFVWLYYFLVLPQQEGNSTCGSLIYYTCFFAWYYRELVKCHCKHHTHWSTDMGRVVFIPALLHSQCICSA